MKKKSKIRIIRGHGKNERCTACNECAPDIDQKELKHAMFLMKRAGINQESSKGRGRL